MSHPIKKKNSINQFNGLVWRNKQPEEKNRGAGLGDAWDWRRYFLGSIEARSCKSSPQSEGSLEGVCFGDGPQHPPAGTLGSSQSRWQPMANSSREPLGHWPRPINGGPAGGERMSCIPDTPATLISLCFLPGYPRGFLGYSPL